MRNLRVIANEIYKIELRESLVILGGLLKVERQKSFNLEELEVIMLPPTLLRWKQNRKRLRQPLTGLLVQLTGLFLVYSQGTFNHLLMVEGTLTSKNDSKT